MFKIGVGLFAALVGAVLMCGAIPSEAEGFGCHGRAFRQRQVIREKVVVQEIVQPVVVQKVRVQRVRVQPIYVEPVVVQEVQSCYRQPVYSDCGCGGVPVIQQQVGCQQFFRSY